MKRLLTKLSTRRCRGCTDESYHSHHLTRLGQWRYIDRFPVAASDGSEEQ